MGLAMSSSSSFLTLMLGGATSLKQLSERRLACVGAAGERTQEGNADAVKGAMNLGVAEYGSVVGHIGVGA